MTWELRYKLRYKQGVQSMIEICFNISYRRVYLNLQFETEYVRIKRQGIDQSVFGLLKLYYFNSAMCGGDLGIGNTYFRGHNLESKKFIQLIIRTAAYLQAFKHLNWGYHCLLNL